MALSLIILAEGPSADLVAHLGQTAAALYARLLGDTVAVAQQLPDTRVIVRYSPEAARALQVGLPRRVELVPIGCDGPPVAAALADGLASGGPALVIGGDLPDLPPWRLRDAATYLADDADVVIGPSDSGSWYLVGLRAGADELLRDVPARGASFAGLAAASSRGHVVHLLPPWFGVTTVGELASMADALRTMPPDVAAYTRALIEAGQASRAVGG